MATSLLIDEKVLERANARMSRELDLGDDEDVIYSGDDLVAAMDRVEEAERIYRDAKEEADACAEVQAMKACRESLKGAKEAVRHIHRRIVEQRRGGG